MSQLLDALRGNRERAHASIPSVASASGSLVISSLGLPASPRRRIPSTWIVVACSLAGALAGGSLTWRPAAADLIHSSALFDRAVALQEAGDFDRAVEIYEALLARDELPAQVHNNLGLIYQHGGRLEQAARELENALAHDPQYSRAHYNLAVLFDRSGERARAAEHYRAFLEHRGSDHASLTSDVRARLAALAAAR